MDNRRNGCQSCSPSDGVLAHRRCPRSTSAVRRVGRSRRRNNPPALSAVDCKMETVPGTLSFSILRRLLFGCEWDLSGRGFVLEGGGCRRFDALRNASVDPGCLWCRSCAVGHISLERFGAALWPWLDERPGKPPRCGRNLHFPDDGDCRRNHGRQPIVVFESYEPNLVHTRTAVLRGGFHFATH